MRKYLTMLAVAMICVSGRGNNPASGSEANNGSVSKSLEIPVSVNTPYSVSNLSLETKDVIAITLDNDGRARITIIGDGEKGISTRGLRRMVAIQALLSNNIDASQIKEEQLDNFVSLPDIGMTVEEWAANYNKPLDEIKRVNAKGIMPVHFYSGSAYQAVRGWPHMIRNVVSNIKDDKDFYSLRPKKEEPQEETMSEEEPEPELELAEEVLNTEVVLWNDNIKPREKSCYGYDLVIVADENSDYENIERLLSDLRWVRPKFVTSQRAIDDNGWWAHGKRNVCYISFLGIGDFVESYDDITANYPDINFYLGQKRMTVIVDNVRDERGRPVMDNNGRHKLTSWVVEPGKAVRDAISADFAENENLRPRGLRGMLYYRNKEVISAVENYQEEVNRKRISAEEFFDKLNALNRECLENCSIPFVVLKFAPGATYEAFIAALDEMYINEILYWRIGKLTPEEVQYIRTHPAR